MIILNYIIVVHRYFILNDTDLIEYSCDITTH